MAQSSHLKPVNYEPSKFATEFCELYCNIIPKLYNVKCDRFLDNVKKELKNIRRMKYFIISKEEMKSSCEISFEKIAVRCAYLYSYSVIHTSVVYREFSKHLEENANEEMLLQHFSSKTLKLCCLGGGAGFEVVGVSKAINDVIWKSIWREVRPPVDIHVTIVDICSEWKSEQSAIINELNKKSNSFHSEKVNFEAEFFKADLLKPFEESLQDIIKEANIITIAKFASALEEKNQKDCIPNMQSMMKRVIDCMSEESCLFMLDSAGGSVFYRSVQVTSNHYKGVFKPQLIKHKAYRLHPKTLQRLEGVLNFRDFAGSATLFPTQLTKISSCIWIKKSLTLIQMQMKEEKETRRKERTEAKMERKRKRMAEQKMKEENEKVGTEIMKERREEESNKEDMKRKESNEAKMLINKKLKEEKERREKKKANKEKKRIEKQKVKEENEKIKKENIKGKAENITYKNEKIIGEKQNMKDEIRKEKNDEENMKRKESNEAEMLINQKLTEERQRRRKEKRNANKEKKRIEKQKVKEENEKIKEENGNIRKKAENITDENEKIKGEKQNMKEEIRKEKNDEEEVRRKESNERVMLEDEKLKEEKQMRRKEKREAKIERKRIAEQTIKWRMRNWSQKL